MANEKPLLFDSTPRFQEFAVPPSPSQSAVLSALEMLRPMVRARGYTGRVLEVFDTVLVCSERWVHDMEKLKREFPNLVIQVVPAQVLKTAGSWALTHGRDAVISNAEW